VIIVITVVLHGIVLMGKRKGEDTRMSTTAVEVKGPNPALFRATALAASVAIWGGLGYLALTYVPQFKAPIEIEPPPISVVPREPVKPVLPILAPLVKKEMPNIIPQPTNTVAPPITTRTPAATDTNPLKGELMAGPVATIPATSGYEGPVTNVMPWVDPLPIAPIIPEPVIAPITPPQPIAKLVINPVRVAGANPVFPDRALDRGVSGEVTLSFTVSALGTVENINVTGENPSGYGFARAARQAIQSWTFQPQTIDGVPVAYPARYTISFKLED
jgi:periplasmic protein TonB